MKLRRTLIAAGAAATLVVAGSIGTAGMASAQTPGEAPPAAEGKRQHVRETFLSRLTANLNISLEQLKAAVKEAALQTVDDLVADGTLTEEQGAKITEKINSGDGFGIGRLLREHRGRQQPVGPHELRERARRLIVQSAAEAIGIERGELREELRGGASIAEVAAEHGVSLDTVKAQIMADAEAALDKAVANHKLTQGRADAMLQKLERELDDILNKKRG